LTQQLLWLLSAARDAEVVVEVELGAELEVVDAVAAAAVALAGAVPVPACAEELPANVSAEFFPESIVNNEMLSPYSSHVAQRVPLST